MSYDAVVYDLDGTLVELPVDWGAVDREVRDVVAKRTEVDPAGRDAWDLLPVAERAGERAAVEEILSRHERASAPEARRLALAEEMAGEKRPVGVCSLNCEAAVRAALERHDLADSAASIVGRDTVKTEKPDPEPLLRVVEALGVSPERTLFVGDSERDERTAERAGTGFAYVAERANRS